MTIVAARVRERGVTFAAALVKPFVLYSPTDRERWMHACQQLFEIADVVLVDENGRTWGSANAVSLLRNVAVWQIPWREFSIS